jgi:hypothetical protein
LQNLKEITSSTHTPVIVLEDSLVARGCEYILPYLCGNDARKLVGDQLGTPRVRCDEHNGKFSLSYEIEV